LQVLLGQLLKLVELVLQSWAQAWVLLQQMIVVVQVF
jgi:hypothetical protein